MANNSSIHSSLLIQSGGNRRLPLRDRQNSTFLPANELENDELRYNMSHRQRGKALIFNHCEYDPVLQLRTRDGTDYDVGSLQNTLVTLGFQLHTYYDLPWKDIEAELDAVVAGVTADCNALLVAILTHGDEDTKLCAYDRAYNGYDVWAKFTRSNCPQLVGKPKIFLFQACMGKKIDDGVHFQTQRTSSDFVPSSKYPEEADFLMGYSSTPGYLSFRRGNAGSCFIQAFCEIVQRYHATHDLLSMTTMVNRKVALEFESNKKSNPHLDKKKIVPLFTHTLTRKVFF